MNAIAANELKRHGIAAVEKLFPKGPVHVIKRNRPVCVVLTEEEYQRLTRSAGMVNAPRQLSVLEWLSLPPLGSASKNELDDRLARERDGWETP
jgi:hypothetical protein